MITFFQTYVLLFFIFTGKLDCGMLNLSLLSLREGKSCFHRHR